MSEIVVNGRFLGPAEPTGVGRVARSLLGAARTARRRGWSVHAPRPTADPLVDETYGTARTRAGGAAWEQVALVQRGAGRPLLSLANTGPVAAGHGLVLVHDLAPLTEPAWFHPRMRHYARITLLAARRAEVVMAVSSATADELVARGVRSERIHVVAPAVDDVFRRPGTSDEDAARRTRLGVRRPYLLVVGACDPRKDVAVAAAASRHLAGRHPHQLVLVGRPHPNLGPVALPGGPSVHHLPRVDDGELAALYRGAEALLYPSRHEGYGLPPLEAQACGTPAVVSDIAVLRESAGPTATRVAVGDVSAWTEATERALTRSLATPTRPTRTWHDAAVDLLAALGLRPDPPVDPARLASHGPDASPVGIDDAISAEGPLDGNRPLP